MDHMSTVQARTSSTLKENATDILEKLGLNISTYINMALNQLVIQKKIPFEVQLNSSFYSVEEAVEEVQATLSMEGMNLNKQEIELLRDYRKGMISGDDLRKKILEGDF